MIYTVAFQKGGTGKTSTAHAIAAGATARGKKALAIDFDPQSNLSFAMGANPAAPGAYEILTGRAQISDTIQHTSQGDVVPAGLNLAAAEAEIGGQDGRDFLLQSAIKPVVGLYDVIVIDTPPALGTLLINALTAADAVVITMNADIFSLQGLYQLMETVEQVRRYCNKGLTVSGVLLTKYSGRTTLARDITETVEETARKLGVGVLSAKIREGVAVKEAQTLQESLFDHAPKSNPAKDYAAFLDEIGI